MIRKYLGFIPKSLHSRFLRVCFTWMIRYNILLYSWHRHQETCRKRRGKTWGCCKRGRRRRWRQAGRWGTARASRSTCLVSWTQTKEGQLPSIDPELILWEARHGREKVKAPQSLKSDGVDDSEIEQEKQEKRNSHCDKDLHILLVHLRPIYIFIIWDH